MLRFGFKNKNALPRAGLLIYLARPNSDEYLIGQDTIVGQDTYIWGYVLPALLFTQLGEGLFFAADGEPKVVLASEILADPNTNIDHVLFRSTSISEQTGKLAIYDPATPLDVLAQAYRVLGLTFIP